MITYMTYVTEISCSHTLLERYFILSCCSFIAGAIWLKRNVPTKISELKTTDHVQTA